MKTDLATSVIAAIAGILIAYFVTNMFIGPIEDVTYTTVDSSVNASLADPNPEVFNYRALNPTVEVYVGECDEYNEFGECIEVETSTKETVEEEIIEETTNPTEKSANQSEPNTEPNQENN